MSLLGFITSLIMPEKAEEVKNTSAVTKAAPIKKASDKENIPMVSKETAAQQKNEDCAAIKTRTREQVYKLIEDICVDYRMTLEDAKKANLLEKISGCSTEELLKKSDDEIQSYIEPLKHTLKWQSWKLPWQNRDIDDINKIAKKANERYIYTQTGRSFLGNLFRKHGDVSKRLSKEGFEVSESGVKAYFENLIANSVKSGNPKKIQKAYDDALIIFGDLLNDTEEPQQKQLLTAAIEKLQAGKRALAANLSIASCQDNIEARQAAARGISMHYEAITCCADALGEYTSNDDNVSISHTSFSNMSEQDSLTTLEEMKSRRKEIEAKIQNGESLTETEQRYYTQAQCSQYAGALTGTACNSYIEDKQNVLSTIDRDTEEFGIQEQVYTTALNYVENHQDTLPITKKAFTQTMDKATNNNYSAVIEKAQSKTSEKHSPKPENTETQTEEAAKNPNKNITKDYSNKNADEKTTYTSSTTKAQNPETTAYQAESDKTSTGTKSNDSKTVTNPVKTNSAASNKGNQDNTTQNKTTATSSAKIQHIIETGSIKEIKQYAKENKIRRDELAIEILNCKSANPYLKEWALEQFDKMDDSMKKIYFARLKKNETIIDAAKLMDTKELSNMTFNNFFVKQSVDNIIDKRKHLTC